MLEKPSIISLILIASAAITASAQGVRSFGVPPGKLPPRGFGNPEGEEALRVQFPEAAAAVIGDDWARARGQIERTDGNGNGIVTQEEWTASGYQRPTQFYYNDLNHDGKITLYEQTLGFAAWRRGNERRADARVSAARAARPKPEPEASTAAIQSTELEDPQAEARRRQAWDLSAYVLQVYDINQSGVVERNEFQSATSRYGNLVSADADANGEVRRDELSRWLINRLPRLPSVQLSLQFQSLDKDQDGQVSLREYTPDFQSDAVAQFEQWDANGDGLVTPSESQNRPQPARVEYANSSPQVLKPGGTIVSRIWIEEDLPIETVNVFLNLSKEADSYTEVHLVGPDGTRVTLQEGGAWVPWMGGLILKHVVFSDQGATIRQPLRSPPPPSQRIVAPPGVVKDDMPSLVDFKGIGTRGLWRLVIVNQNNRAGLLLHWELQVTPGKGRPNAS